MTPNGRQDDNIDEKNVSGASQQGLENPGRRRFGRSGIAATGIIATLTSKPVLGTVCKSPSGFLSGNLSNQKPPSACAGRSPGYWKNHDWPIPNRTTAKFKSVFTVPAGSPYFTVTMLALLDPQDFDKYNFGMHLVAAYLNFRAGWSPFLDTARLQAMWTEVRTVGYFTPTAGVKWTAEQCVDYIQQTFAY
ncbi:hypothetical protein [Noviherbaspirillum sp. ST9]|uniref:hypothetical protein n=1 Tax=Noviherbaspirillum sp. ST9 TaxID=3401606 RepID=UPI003B5889A6